MSVCIDCTRKWIDNAVQNFSSSSVQSRDKIVRVRRMPLPAGPVEKEVAFITP